MKCRHKAQEGSEMKKLKHIFLIVFLACCRFASGQPTIEIHHIDVGTGDATLIKVNSVTRARPYSILIDAGKTNAASDVITYLWNNASKVNDTIALDYVLTSHFHEDHIGGFVGNNVYIPVATSPSKVKLTCTGELSGVLGKPQVNIPGRADLIPPVRFFSVFDKGDSQPVSSSIVFGDYKKLANANGQTRRVAVGTYTAGLGMFSTDSVLPPAVYPFPTPGLTQFLSLGGFIFLGRDVNGVPIRLRLVLANAYVYMPNIPGRRCNVADLMNVERDPDYINSRPNDNNWGLGWVLEYGAFRYYTAGDVGGYSGKGCAQYFDIETTLAKAFKYIYPQPDSGHVCAFKTSHHGSHCSNNENLLDTMKAAVTVISSGMHSGYGHPDQEVLDYYEKYTWHHDSLLNDKMACYFLTTLGYNDKDIDTAVGRTSGCTNYVCTNVVPAPAIVSDSWAMVNGAFIYELTNVTPKVKGNIVIKVSPQDENGIPITRRSAFEVQYNSFLSTDPPIIRKVACHKQ